MTGLSVQILGRLTATRDGQLLDLGGQRQRAVLGILIAARGAVIPAARVVDLLWGDDPPPSANGAAQAHVSHLRRALEPERVAHAPGTVLVSEGPGYAIRLNDNAVDAWRFEAAVTATASNGSSATVVAKLRAALELWRGPAFAEYAGQPWADAESVRFRELHRVACEQLWSARLALGEARLVVPELEGAVADEPLREERWRLLALALYRSHRQSDALTALRRARTMLADELGVDPGPALRDLEAEILAQSPSLLPSIAASAESQDPAPIHRPTPR